MHSHSTESEISLHFVNNPLQSNGYDCGLLAEAFATALAFGQQPELYHHIQEEMRKHLLKGGKNENVSI